MKANPVTHCIFIIRSQAEYSAVTQSVSLRCLLEAPTTGERHGFTDVETLLAALRAQLLEMQNQIIPSNQEKGQL